MHDTQHTTVPTQGRPPKPDYADLFLEPACGENHPFIEEEGGDE